jgi:Lrp/AsnC family leucine-responsive transcriptional regulator
MDQRDLEVLALLQDNARISNSEIGRRLGVAPSAILERIRKLERQGAIRGYTTRLDPAQLDAGLLSFIFVQADERPGGEDLGARLAEIPEVQEAHHIAGEDCYLIKVRCNSTDALGKLLKQRLGAFPEIRRTRSIIVLGTIKEEASLPIPPVASEDHQ